MRVNSLFYLINNLVLNFVGIPQSLTPLIKLLNEYTA